MKEDDSRKEPQSTTAEKKSITKTHEEFIDDTRSSMTKQEYEKIKRQKEANEERKGRD